MYYISSIFKIVGPHMAGGGAAVGDLDQHSPQVESSFTLISTSMSMSFFVVACVYGRLFSFVIFFIFVDGKLAA